MWLIEKIQEFIKRKIFDGLYCGIYKILIDNLDFEVLLPGFERIDFHFNQKWYTGIYQKLSLDFYYFTEAH